MVFLFEDSGTFGNFVDNGWQVSAGANAVAGDKGQNVGASATNTDATSVSANASAGYVDGMAVYQLTEKGLMLQADLSGTKYWKPDKLND